MTPGDAALMNASSTSAPSTAALRFAMSARTASRSLYLTGPMQAGISKSRSPMTRCMNSGNSTMSAGIPASPPVPPKPSRRSFTYVE